MTQSFTEQASLKRLGKRIKQLRRSMVITQEELAERAGVHRTYVSMIERGEKNVTVLSAQKVATALGVSLSELFESYEDGQ